MISVDNYLKNKEAGLTKISKMQNGVFLITSQQIIPQSVGSRVKIEEIDIEIASLQKEIDNLNLLKKDLEEVK
jgi:hypothetical protein